MEHEEVHATLNALNETMIERWVEAKIEILHNQARILVNDYWHQLEQGQKSHHRSERGHIGVRIRRREKCLSFSIEWFRIAMLRQDSQNKTIAQYIRKGLGYRYPLARMLQNEPVWEAEIIEELEDEFEDIRRQIDLLGKIRDRVRAYVVAPKRGR